MKKHVKSLLSIMMVLVLTLSIFAGFGVKDLGFSIKSSAAERDEQDSGADWTLYKDGELVVDTYIEVTGEGKAPWYNNSTSVKTVTLMDEVDRLDAYTFQECSNIRSIFIPITVDYVDPQAFAECSSLTKIYYEGSADQWKGITTEVYDTKVVYNHNYHDDATKVKAESRRAVKATCKNAGYSGDKYCLECGSWISDGKKVEQLTTHTWSSTTITKEAATCSKKGVKGRQCTVCGIWDSNSLTEIPATGKHVYNTIIKSNGNCKSTSGVTYTVKCETCDKTQEKTSKSHSIVDKYYEPTCTAKGGTHSECRYCLSYEAVNSTNITLDDGTTVAVHDVESALGHDSGVYKTIQKATCVNDGVQVLICKRCGEEIGERTAIEKLGHTYSADLDDSHWTVVNEATCTEQGNRVYTCPRCNEDLGITYRDDIKESEQAYYNLYDLRNTAKDNDELKVINKMIDNCTIPCYHAVKDGKPVYPDSCEWKSEGTYKINDYVADVTATKATCVSTGLQVLVCSKCNCAVSDGEKWNAVAVTKATEKNANNHVTYAPTVADNGDKFDADSVWTYDITGYTIPSSLKINSTDIKEPTCKEKGLQAKVCPYCKAVIETKEVEALGHNYENIDTYNCTSTEVGTYIHQQCTRCNDKNEFRVTKKYDEHEFVDDYITEPTCTAAGSKRRICKVCGQQSVDYGIKTIDKLEHSYETVKTIPATCDEVSKTIKVCKNCNLVKVESGTEQVGHDNVKLQKESKTDPTCTTPGLIVTTCTRCGKIISEKVDPDKKEALNHKWVVDAKVLATCKNTGKTEGKHCERCGKIDVKQKAIPKKDHVLVDDPGYPATCVADGLTGGKHCEVCGEVTIPQEVISHTANDHLITILEAQPVTCTEDGLTEGQFCAACNTVLVRQQVIKATGHKEVEGTSKITKLPIPLIRKGEREYDCSVCGERVTEEYSVNFFEWLVALGRSAAERFTGFFSNLFSGLNTNTES